ncbi:MAG TPA: MoaD/ThiS family protein [Pseudomonadales bacterium]|nr:MoaD/ThiS family protein [Pseudomonadales bacterium]
MKVVIPSVLQSYTRGARSVDADGATLADLLADLDMRFPGIRFRMINEADALRPHVRIFVNREAVTDLRCVLSRTDDVVIVQALSGG